MSIIEYIKYLYRQSRRPSYLLPEPKPESRKVIKARKIASAQRDLRRKALVDSKAYLSYEIPNPVHIEDYIYIDTKDWIEPNPILYQIIVPLPQELYYKGRRWRVDCYAPNYNGTKDAADRLKERITDIHRENESNIKTLRRCADKIEHYLTLGIDGVEEIID